MRKDDLPKQGKGVGFQPLFREQCPEFFDI
jgi:hypothetical protein